MAFWAAASFALTAFGALKGNKDKKKARSADATVTAKTLKQEAFEIGRVERKRAANERSLLTAGGISSRSGSAQATERDTMREAAYQQESVLAGLPKGHINTLASFRGEPKKPSLVGYVRKLVLPPDDSVSI